MPRERTIPVNYAGAPVNYTNTPVNYTGAPATTNVVTHQVTVNPSPRKTSIDEIGDKIVGMLDEIERRVENLRETAAVMEQEKEQLIEMLNTVSLNKEMLRIGQGKECLKHFHQFSQFRPQFS